MSPDSILVSPDKIGTAVSFEKEVEAFLAWAQSQPRQSSQVLLPGDPERANKGERLKNGIPIDPTTWEQICRAAETAGLSRTDLR